jgi:hypothetical protein
MGSVQAKVGLLMFAFVNRDIIPQSWMKHLIVYSGAPVGGYIFALTQSWLEAIRWDLCTIACVWMSVKIAEMLSARFPR